MSLPQRCVCVCNLCVLCSVRVWCGVGFYPGHRESGGGFFWDPPVIGAAEQPKPQKETRGESQFSTLFFFKSFFFFLPSVCVCAASWPAEPAHPVILASFSGERRRRRRCAAVEGFDV